MISTCKNTRQEHKTEDDQENFRKPQKKNHKKRQEQPKRYRNMSSEPRH